MDTLPGRRLALMTMVVGVTVGAAGLAALRSGMATATGASLLPLGATSLEELSARLSKTPRRRFPLRKFRLTAFTSGNGADRGVQSNYQIPLGKGVL
ncbi:hypothetical protein MES5069_510040 [Mesorhizobium escarrei]|uniref:Oxidoreductase n=2 Tax=Mesorhizobium escarrei TaxID=666018 RepID=A0ABM9EA74_9HYPH|nr:hypothetical protein MES5069_510040 [Mesorhizobium escarrei]